MAGESDFKLRVILSNHVVKKVVLSEKPCIPHYFAEKTELLYRDFTVKCGFIFIIITA